MNPVDEHRDPDVDAAWRAASGEHPPASLDAAITAAARRAVGAGPKSLQGSRAWWPVAAAAVVAVVAIGIVEMTPPEQVAPTMTTAAPQPASAPAAEPAAKQDATHDQRAPAAIVAEPAPSRATEGGRKVERASPPAPTPSAPAASEAARAKTSQPFPASPSDSRATDAAVAPIDRASEAPASSMMRQQAAPAGAGASAQQAPASAAGDARESAPAAAAGALAPREEPKPSNAPAALAKRARDKAATLDEAPQRSVDEWIVLIRRLKAEGRNELAAKELAAFRARYQDRADALLPADLREPRP